ncbi:MAG: hypothetical protein U0003_01965 [Vampirovibrionales bacterium]
MASTSSIIHHPWRHSEGRGFSPQPIEAAWLSQREISIAISGRWALVPGQAVRITGPTNASGLPHWEALATVISISPYLDGQRIELASHWGNIGGDAAWIEGLDEPIHYLMQRQQSSEWFSLLGQPLGLQQGVKAYLAAGHGLAWQLSGTCVAGLQAIIGELTEQHPGGWIIDGAGWYTSPPYIEEAWPKNDALWQTSPEQQAFMIYQGLRLTADLGLPLPKAPLPLTHPTTQSMIEWITTLSSLFPHLPSFPITTLHHPNILPTAQWPECWQQILSAWWPCLITQQKPPLVVLIHPEINLPNSQATWQQLLTRWLQQGTHVVWATCPGHSAPALSQWHYAEANIAWPFDMVDENTLSSYFDTQNTSSVLDPSHIPYDVLFKVNGPLTAQLDIAWSLPGNALPAGAIQWQTPQQISSSLSRPVRNPVWVEPMVVNTATLSASKAHLNEIIHQEQVALTEPPATVSSLIHPDVGPLPDLSDLTHLPSENSELSALKNLTLDNETTSLPTAPPPINPSHAPHSAWHIGQSVQHPQYGTGVIENLIPTGKRLTVQVQFQSAGCRLLDSEQGNLFSV